jgi:hypothetical protein
MENTSSSTVSHRVVREFTSDGLVHYVGDLVSDADWTAQGRQYVESLGWVVALTPAEIMLANTQQPVETTSSPEPDVSDDVVEIPAPKPVRKNAVKKAQAAKRPATKRSVKPTAE